MKANCICRRSKKRAICAVGKVAGSRRGAVWGNNARLAEARRIKCLSQSKYIWDAVGAFIPAQELFVVSGWAVSLTC
eukprot:SAG31_NODE_4214_length_3460_cov_2.941386_2_plen_77_part_00